MKIDLDNVDLITGLRKMVTRFWHAGYHPRGLEVFDTISLGLDSIWGIEYLAIISMYSSKIVLWKRNA